MTRAELIALANQILESNGSEAEIDALMELFDQNVPPSRRLIIIFLPRTRQRKRLRPQRRRSGGQMPRLSPHHFAV